MMTKKVRDAVLAAGRGLVLTALSMAGSALLFCLTLVSIQLIPLGVGVITTPFALKTVRAHAEQRCRLAERWAGKRIPASYGVQPAVPRRTGFLGQAELCFDLLKDPATWRDLRWLAADMSAGAVLAVLPAILVADGLFGLLLATGLWRPISEADHGDFWYTFIPVTSQGTANLAALLGCVWLVLGLYANRPLIGLHFRLAESLLPPGREAELHRRIDRLTETRHDALDTSAAELRRIERDLHDGAQARLVAMGMSLSTIEALIERDPDQAKELLAHARRSSAEALTELRDLVRGIHPPVLAERGLPDAIRALALRLPIRTEVAVDLVGRADAPVESAAYFAVSEALTNAVKHSGADRIWIDIAHRDGMLRISVTDDGRGGAKIGAGSGLTGVERRLGTFDGVLAVSSPAGGPSLVTMEIPCVLS
ncbi:sensor domain-containing protein [Streptomyces sannanensis]|uniref:histidine kinase n=1 Tax=Streptomyces sannanensis TaxID=285536 RepID=A0ABP6S8U9_9ACTN